MQVSHGALLCHLHSPMRALHCVQFVDDVLDFTGSTMQLGKPTLNDLRSGLATAPVLYAAEEHPELNTLILRRFKSEGEQSCVVTVCPSRPSAALSDRAPLVAAAFQCVAIGI